MHSANHLTNIVGQINLLGMCKNILYEYTFLGSQDNDIEAKAFMPAAFHIYKHYSTTAAYSVFPDFVDFVRKFRTERPEVQTIVISKSDKRILNILLQLGLLPLLDDVIY